MRKKSELFFNILLLPIDFAAVMGAFVLAYIIRVQLEGRPVANPLGIELFLRIVLLAIPVWILIFALSGLYSLSSLRSRMEEIGKIFVAVSGGVMFLILMDFLSRTPIFPSKAVPVYGYGLSFIFVVLGRWIINSIQRYLFSYNIGIHRAVVVGSGEIAGSIIETLKDTADTGYRLVAVIDNAEGASNRIKALTVYPSFQAFLKDHGAGSIDEIVQADSALEPEEILELINYANNHHLIYRFIPNQFGLYATHSTVSTLAGLPIIEIQQTPLEGWGRIIKRVFDLVGATIGLVLLSPLFLLIALVIKLTDPGPVFYHHRRLSRAGTPIYIHKFRTMKTKYSTGAAFGGKTDAEVFADMGQPELAKDFARDQKLRNDPRVSTIGHWLRKTSLDELPQLFNVVQGNLSLVGPRPVVEDELERYGTDKAIFLALKPGITGLWQISGRSDLDYDERVKLDIYYVENWSLLLDIRILLKTVWSLLTGRGAY